MAKPIKAPIEGMPMPVGKRPAPPPFPIPHPAQMQAPQAAPQPHFAQGTPNVPAPGQTVTNGSWTGPTPQPAPLSPSPLSGQNTGLRARLGLSAGTPRFAEGTSDVGGPNVGAEDGQPAQGYDAQTASYSGLDQHFVAHLRAAIGLAPKPQGFSSGTDDAVNPNDFSARAQQQDAPAPASTGPLLPPGFTLQGAPGFTNKPPDLPGPNYGGQPGGTVDPSPQDFTMRAADQQIDPLKGAAGPNPNGQPGGSLPGATQNFSRAGSQDPLFGSLIQALVGQPQTTTSTGKPITDQNLNHAVTQLSGADPSHVDAVLNPHEYTREQFQAAVANMPWGMAKSLWAMQHYLNPTQRAQGQYFGQLDQGVLNAQNADKGTTQASLKAYEKNLQDALNARTGARKKVTEPQSYYGADQSVTNDSQGG